MPRPEIEQSIEQGWVDLEPTVEVLGKLSELSFQKSGGMDAFQKPMSG